MISQSIKNIIPSLQKYMSAQPILKAWLFGSCSRGEERSDSDLDILVDYDYSHGRVSLLTMGGILMDLSEIAGRKVDLVEYKGLMDFARPSVERDKILIYERTI
ncbi:MAG: nucleotidyltransferase domain-containing protein [Muribaculaceae bacterium]|nr:nucleotidyltransferase domain-containing protein [Muribaculaceae bacterium]